MLTSLFVALLLMFAWSMADAVRLTCPYDVFQEDGTWIRHPLTERFIDRMRQESGRQDPFIDADEVAGNRVEVELPDGLPVTAVLLSSGCTLTRPGRVRQAARAPTIRNGTLVYDDPAQPIVNPHRLQRSSLVRGYQFVRKLLAPGLSYALGVWPTAVVFDNFNRTDEDPIASPWVNNAPQSCTLSNVIVSGNEASGTTANTSCAYYSLKQCTADCDSHYTVAAATNNGHRMLHIINLTGWDGYHLRTNTATTMSIYRVDDGVETILTGTYTTAVVETDKIGLRHEGSDLTGYINTTSIGTPRVDSTYAGPAYIGIRLNGTAQDIDDFAASFPSGLSLGVKLLK